MNNNNWGWGLLILKNLKICLNEKPMIIMIIFLMEKFEN